MNRLFLLGLLFVFSAVAQAQSHPARASYRVWVNSGGGGRSGGSSTGISKWAVVTNAHVVGRASRAEVLHPLLGKRWEGYVVSRDTQADLALIYIPQGDVEWVELGEDPQPAKPCFLFGYGGDSVLKQGTGKFMKISGHRAPGVPVWDSSVESISGDSGSGLFDEQGRLTAVNWGGGSRKESASTPVSFVRNLAQKWVTEFIEVDPQARQIFSRGGGCFGGFCGPSQPSYGGGDYGGMMPPKSPISQVPPPSAPGSPVVPIGTPGSPIQAPQQPPVTQPPPLVPQQPPVTPPVAQPPAPALDTEKLVGQLVEKLASDPRFKGPAGPAGPAGEKGPAGPAGERGPAGKDAVIDMDAIAAAILKKLPPIHVQRYDVYGQLVGEQYYPYPGPIRLQDIRGQQYTTSPR